MSRIGRGEEAVAHDREAIAAFESIGITGGVACGYCNLADVLTDLGRLDEAAEAARAGLDAARSIGHKIWIASALYGHALIADKRHDCDETVRYCEQAAEIFEQIGDPRDQEARELAAQARRDAAVAADD